MLDDDRSWTAFASNVGKARILRHDVIENRLRWAGAILLLLAVAAAVALVVRYFGIRAGWWTSLLPIGRLHATVHGMVSSTQALSSRIFDRFSR
jgi:hypothetical protein